MNLLVKPNDSKYWRLKYRFASKEKMLSISVYSDISLIDAREEARKTLTTGGDSGEVKTAEILAQKLSFENTFEAIAHEEYKQKTDRESLRYRDEIIDTSEKDIFPYTDKRMKVRISIAS